MPQKFWYNNHVFISMRDRKTMNTTNPLFDPEFLGPCEEAEGYAEKGGYKRVMVGGRRLLVHRKTWEDAHGAIPCGMIVMHRCNNPSCRKLSHLRLATHAENSAHMVACGRAGRGGRAGLPPDIVSVILTAPADVNQSLLARELGVTQAVVSKYRIRAGLRGVPGRRKINK